MNDNPSADAQNNVQIGMVQAILPDVDPVLGGLLPNKHSLQSLLPNDALGLDGLSPAALKGLDG